METVINIAQIILFISVSLLCVYLIGAVTKIGKTLTNLENSINNLQKKLDPILDNLNYLTEKTKKITDSVSEQIDITKSAVNSFKMIAEDVLGFERKIKDTIEKPVIDFVNIIMGFLSGIKSITGFLRKDKE